MGGGHVPEPTRESLYEPVKRGDITDTFLFKFFDAPTDWFKRNVTDRFRQKYPYYHRRYPRVPTIDQCFVDDFICFEEAERQFKRDRMVDLEIVHILKKRKEDCNVWYGRQRDLVAKHCAKAIEDYEDAATNYFIKYGEIGTAGNVKTALMKQKHRMLWERKYGEVGSRGDPDKWPSIFVEAEEHVKHEDTMLGNLRKFSTPDRTPKEMAP